MLCRKEINNFSAQTNKWITSWSGNEQEQYWRIPGKLTAASLKTKATVLARALEGNFEVGDLNPDHLGGRSKAKSSASKPEKEKKKKRRKRGPNKWMPMKRQVDEEALARLIILLFKAANFRAKAVKLKPLMLTRPSGMAQGVHPIFIFISRSDQFSKFIQNFVFSRCRY